MSDKLIITAAMDTRNDRHATIKVWQNGALAGVLTVEARYVAQVIERLTTSMQDWIDDSAPAVEHFTYEGPYP